MFVLYSILYLGLSLALQDEPTVEVLDGDIVLTVGGSQHDVLIRTETETISVRGLQMQVNTLHESLIAINATLTQLSADCARQTDLQHVANKVGQQIQNVTTSCATNSVVEQLDSRLSGNLTVLDQRVDEINKTYVTQPAYKADFDSYAAAINVTLETFARFDDNRALTLPRNSSEACTAESAGGIRYDREDRAVHYCDGATWQRVGPQPLGTSQNPGPTCNAIFNSGFGSGRGKYFLSDPLDEFQAVPILVVCDMTKSPAVSLGGDGKTQSTASTSCSVLLNDFQIETGLFYVAAKAYETNDASTLVVDGAVQVYCDVDGDTVTQKESGLTENHPASSCSDLKAHFNLPSAVYWIGQRGAAKQLLCDTEHPDGISLGGDGTAADLASASCYAIEQHHRSLNKPYGSAQYFVISPVDSAVVLVYCDFSTIDSPKQLGGDGSSIRAASSSCETLQSVWSKGSGIYYIDPDAEADDPSNARSRVCILQAATLHEFGGDGTSSSNAALSCRHLYWAGVSTSKIYWVNPSGSDAFQVYCDQSDDGGWMKFLQYHDRTYTPTSSGSGTIATIDITATGKLSDVRINSVTTGSSSPMKEFKIVGSAYSKYVYLRTATNFADTSRAWNIFSTGTRYICLRASYAPNCFGSSNHETLDTLADPHTSAENDASRFFTDYSTSRDCYAICTNTCRCISCGSTCVNLKNEGNHPPIVKVGMFVRQYQL